MVKSLGAGIWLPGFKSSLCSFLAVWPWADYLNSLCLNDRLRSTKVIIVTCWRYCEGENKIMLVKY